MSTYWQHQECSLSGDGRGASCRAAASNSNGERAHFPGLMTDLSKHMIPFATFDTRRDQFHIRRHRTQTAVFGRIDSLGRVALVSRPARPCSHPQACHLPISFLWKVMDGHKPTRMTGTLRHICSNREGAQEFRSSQSTFRLVVRIRLARLRGPVSMKRQLHRRHNLLLKAENEIPTSSCEIQPKGCRRKLGSGTSLLDLSHCIVKSRPDPQRA